MPIKNGAEAKVLSADEFAERCGVNRVTIYPMLSVQGNPGFLNLSSIIRNMGYEFDVRLKGA